MFFGHIKQVDLQLYPKAIQRALTYLQQTDFSVLPEGRYDIDGDNMYVQVLDLQTKDPTENLPEVHRHYLDVQYLYRGVEKIGVAVDLGNNPIATEYNPQRDILLYQSMENETFLTMRAGNFAVFFPSDVHRPACIDGQVSMIRKVVVKILISTLYQ